MWFKTFHNFLNHIDHMEGHIGHIELYRKTKPWRVKTSDWREMVSPLPSLPISFETKLNIKAMGSLSNILKLNAISSGATGLLLVMFPSTLAHIMGVPGTLPLVLVGLFLVAFAIFVFAISTAKPIRPASVKVVIWLDATWVMASAIALVFLVPVLSAIGSAIVAGVAVWVAGMVYLQSKGLNQLVQKQAS
jgi:hypothetical protein